LFGEKNSQNSVHYLSCQAVRRTAYVDFFYGRVLKGRGLSGTYGLSLKGSGLGLDG